MAERFLREEIRTDYVGSYTAYLYADGHVETDPPGRPMTREDVQRQRVAEATADRLNKMAAAARTADRSADGREFTPSTKRDIRNVPGLRALTQSYHDAMNQASKLAMTARATRGHRDSVVGTFDLGGPVVGERRGERPEYDLEDSPETPLPKQKNWTRPTYPLKAR